MTFNKTTPRALAPKKVSGRMYKKKGRRAEQHIKALAPYQSPWQVLARWPEGKPLCFLGGSGRFAMLATDFYESAWNEFLPGALGAGVSHHSASTQNPPLPLGCGYVGLVSYDDYMPAGIRRDATASRLFRVAAALVFDQEAQQMFSVRGVAAEEDAHWQRSRGERWQLNNDEYLALLNGPPSEAGPPPVTAPLHLSAQTTAAAYLQHCAHAISEINDGRFYQINLLRYFTLADVGRRRDIAARLQHGGGPQAAWLDLPDLMLASFSPERFVQILPRAQGLQVYTQPIKGTMPRSCDRQKDDEAREALRSSRKDQAELHMIVDLMRNDLYRISEPQSVRVESPGEVVSFASVHHRVATLSSWLPPTLIWRDFFAALCPGGSITGAPKHEVMLAIAEYEQRARGYFMGNLFFRGDHGYFDSSILIRTLVGRRSAPWAVPTYEYAAGSGIVSASEPANELAEIDAKCRVLTSSLPASAPA